MADALTPITFADISGWKQSDLALPLAAFQRSANEIVTTASGFRRQAVWGGTRDHWLGVCQAAINASDPHAFFEQWFRPFRVADHENPHGLFTGYYEPLLKGSRQSAAAYPVPVYARPPDLVAFTAEEAAQTGLSYGRRINGMPLPYDTRRDIENGALQGKTEVICWLDNWVDAFFMHVQGQGRVALDNGTSIRLSYSGKSGHGYTGIGHLLIERGVASKEKMSMQVLRDWMQQHQDEARDLMWTNKSYIFFQETRVEDPDLGGVGAAKVNLTPGHSLAVDRAHWMFGTPLWVETAFPPEAPEGAAALQRLMIAQDTGSAIKGVIRGDFFWGWGARAECIAGHMKSIGRMVAFLPLPLARQMDQAP